MRYYIKKLKLDVNIVIKTKYLFYTWCSNIYLQVPVASWFDDMTDSELLDLIPFFEKLSKVDSIYTVLCNSNHPYHSPPGAQPQQPS